jgi:rod shape-determining protein MreD
MLMKRDLMYLTAGLAALFLQTTVFSHFSVRPDFVLILVVCLGLSEEPFSGVVLAFILGCLTDVFAGSAPGFFALTKTLIFLFVHTARSRLFFDDPLARVGLVSIAALVEALAFVLLVKFRSATTIPSATLGRLIVGSVLLTTLAAPLCFALLRRTGMVLWEHRGL